MDEREVFCPHTSGGEGAYHNVRGVPLELDGDGCGAVFISEDLTELKRASENGRISLKHLIQAEKLAFPGTLVAGLAHDINNPIS